MKNWRPPMVTRRPSPVRTGAEADPNTEPVLTYMTREELKQFKSLRETGKILAFNVKSCPCGVAIPLSKIYCSVKCCKERENEA